MNSFTVSTEQEHKIAKWEKKQDLKVAKSQGLKEPYYGAIAGSMTYCFTPTGLGTILTVQHSNGGLLDVTDYENW